MTNLQKGIFLVRGGRKFVRVKEGKRPWNGRQATESPIARNDNKHEGGRKRREMPEGTGGERSPPLVP